MANRKSKKEVKEEIADEEEETEQDGAMHSPCKINNCSQSHLKKKPEVDLELRLLQALQIYPPSKLRDFVLYGLTEYMGRSFDIPFTADEVLKLLGRFYNLEMLKEDFRLPPAFFDHQKN